MSDYSIEDHIAYKMGFKAGQETQAARIADLEVAINAVHRHAMTQYGIRTFDQCSAALKYIDDICRAALEGGKKDG